MLNGNSTPKSTSYWGFDVFARGALIGAGTLSILLSISCAVLICLASVLVFDLLNMTVKSAVYAFYALSVSSSILLVLVASATCGIGRTLLKKFHFLFDNIGFSEFMFVILWYFCITMMTFAVVWTCTKILPLSGPWQSHVALPIANLILALPAVVERAKRTKRN